MGVTMIGEKIYVHEKEKPSWQRKLTLKNNNSDSNACGMCASVEKVHDYKSISKSSLIVRPKEHKQKNEWAWSFNFICLCLLSRTAKLNFNMSKTVHFYEDINVPEKIFIRAMIKSSSLHCLGAQIPHNNGGIGGFYKKRVKINIIKKIKKFVICNLS